MLLIKRLRKTRRDLDRWVRTLPPPRTIAMEATIFTEWIYDHLLPYAEKLKVAHPRMLRAIVAAKKKNDRRFTPANVGGSPRVMANAHVHVFGSSGEV
jgi:hypothetical protein